MFAVSAILPIWPFVLFSLLLMATPSSLQAEVLISEFLAVNDSSLQDEDGEESDWIEITNTGEAVDLDGWFLTDDAANPTKWRIPAVTIGSGERLVVFASGKNRAVAGDELHANLRRRLFPRAGWLRRFT